MNPIHLFVLEGAVLVVGGGIVGVLTDSWQAVVATQTIVIACAAWLHYRRGKRGIGMQARTVSGLRCWQDLHSQGSRR